MKLELVGIFIAMALLSGAVGFGLGHRVGVESFGAEVDALELEVDKVSGRLEILRHYSCSDYSLAEYLPLLDVVVICEPAKNLPRPMPHEFNSWLLEEGWQR